MPETVEQTTPTTTYTFPGTGAYSTGVAVFTGDGLSSGAGGIVVPGKDGFQPAFTVSQGAGTTVRSGHASTSRSKSCMQSWRLGHAIAQRGSGSFRLKLLAIRKKQVNEYMHRLEVAGLGDRRERMVPELAVAMLACARLGAPHTVIFAGFSADSIADRVNDSGATFAITADGGWRRGNKIPLKDTMDRALEACPGISLSLIHL